MNLRWVLRCPGSARRGKGVAKIFAAPFLFAASMALDRYEVRACRIRDVAAAVQARSLNVFRLFDRSLSAGCNPSVGEGFVGPWRLVVIRSNRRMKREVLGQVLERARIERNIDPVEQLMKFGFAHDISPFEDMMTAKFS